MVVILILPSVYSTTNGCDAGSNDSNTSTTSTGETAIPTTANLRKRFEIDTATTKATTTKNSTNNKAQNEKIRNDDDSCIPVSSQNYIPATDSSWRCYVSSSISPAESQKQPKLYDPYFKRAYNPYRFTKARYDNNTVHQNQAFQNISSNKNSTNPTTDFTSDIVRHVTRVNFYDIDTLQVEFEPKNDDDNDDDNICDTEATTKEEEWITKRKTELTTTRQIETRIKRQVVLEDGCKVVEDSGPIVSTNTTEDTDKQETETTEKRDLGIPTDGSAELLDVDAVDSAAHKDQALTGQQTGKELVISNTGDGKIVKKMVPRPADGLVRQINDKRVISHEEKKDYLEIEDVKHLGDFSDETYVKAVNSGVDNLEAVLLSPENQQQLVPLGPRIVANTTKSFKTIDSEDVEKRCLAQEDGTIITEQKKTTEHEVILDKDLPQKDDHSTGSREKVQTVEAHQHYYKQRDEQNVDLVADGKVIGTEMRYAAETMQIEKEGSLERPGDWDSLSDRMRKMRRQQQKTLMQQHKEATLLADRKDALTKRPLDFDREEETRKGETMKWLESHFGSESTASNDSREDDPTVEPTKKTFFNVTIKSNEGQHATTAKTYERKQWEERKIQANITPTDVGPGKTKFYQGISNWNERKDTPPHFASKAFRDDLRETIERNRLRKGNTTHASREKLNDNGGRYLVEPNDTYVSREDIIQQKRQSLSSQFLARTKRASRENLNEIDSSTLGRKINTSRNDLRYSKPPIQEDNKRIYINGSTVNNSAMKRSDYIDTRAKSYEQMSNESAIPYRYDERTNNGTLKQYVLNEERSTQTLSRPTVPQRRRAIEKKLRQQTSVSPTIQTIVPLDTHSGAPRSRSSTPPNDYDLNETNQNAEYVPSKETSVVTLTKKQTQRTRFAPTTTTTITTTTTSAPQRRSILPTQTVQTQTTPPSNLSTSTVASHKSSRVGQVIGNSLRKLVNKIRSVSAERKMRMKSKSKSREHSPTFQQDTLGKPSKNSTGISTTYQQYNVIDSHIGGHQTSNESEQESIRPPPAQNNFRKESSVQPTSMNGINGHSSQNSMQYKRASSADPYRNESDFHSPRQRYYLGEDPYSSTLYNVNQENIYDTRSRNNKTQYVRTRENLNSVQHQRTTPPSTHAHRYGEDDALRQRNVTTHTLGRFPKGRIAESTPNLNHEYRSTQTLPRKLHDSKQASHNQQYGYNKMPQRSVTTLNGGHSTLTRPNAAVVHHHHQHQLTGPAKPARTYAKALNRSKSFNVHGMNGSNDPSPIYIEKLTRNNYTNSNLKQSQAYKSNPMLNSGLKSPSIVNLISRSQKDLSKIGTKDETTDSDLYVSEHSSYIPTNYVSMHNATNRSHIERDDKKQIFLKELHERAPDLYRTLEGNDYTTKTPTKYQSSAKLGRDTLAH